ncbi:Protein of unknown function (DUF3307) [Fervidobacterium pennivorans DSM 9078]|jgi:hypothetical protein|uniref:DUF3307 domain-containing protein n=1 Tax=Fervidobacterium pennivorans (strain DSM 9078 / Ven5) TaxID=771875 RepID=H9U9I2_FERPD|nr:DUF3307 domain-containing protein [Fervidobacterium pennivorans]AFG34175.1 Protein of unknown function (DUF3307) [Fervidobacterium pennivorans DSM 9078]
MNLIFPYLFLGHLFGDYVLQVSYIATNKSKDLKVLGLHTVLVFFSQVLFIVGKNFSIKSLTMIGLLSGIHFLIDLLKFLCKKKFCNTWYYYLFDQSLHVLSLLFISSQLTHLEPVLPRTLVVLLSVMIFNGYFVSILVHLITSNGKYQRDYIGYALRMIAPIVYLLNPLFLIIYALFCLIPVFKFKKRGSKFNMLSYIITTVSTMILMGVML